MFAIKTNKGFYNFQDHTYDEKLTLNNIVPTYALVAGAKEKYNVNDVGVDIVKIKNLTVENDQVVSYVEESLLASV